MKKILSFILLFVAILLFSTVANARSYSFCLYDNPPFNFKKASKIQGLDMDIINAIIDPKKDKKLIINSQRSVCLKLLKENIVDVVAGNFIFTSDKYHDYRFSTVLYSDPPVLFYRAYEKDIFAVNDVYQLRNTPISVDRTSDFNKVLERMKGEYNIFISKEKNIDVALHKLLNKHIDYLFTSLDIIGLANDTPELSALTNVVLDSTNNYLDIPVHQLKFYYPRGWLFSNDLNKRLKVRSLDLKLRKIYINGTLNKLLKKYHLEFLYPQKYQDGKSYVEPSIKIINN